MDFILNSNTSCASEIEQTAPIANALRMLKRDIDKAFTSSDRAGGMIILKRSQDTAPEAFIIDVSENITVYASDDLGFVYGILYISEKFIGIKPFWFWLDQQITKTEHISVPCGQYHSVKPAVKYRGWFINDEVLIMKWDINGDSEEPWRMAFETLLRCGGNMVIPGTDKNSKIYRKLASDMGLWITHHHAEPLGAEMFVRAHPDMQPNYSLYPELFEKLWEDAVKEQKDLKVIWALGFRGQGDCPFWSHDSSGQYDTPEKRGKLISELVEKQKRLISKYVKDPVFCTNLYGEIMELYDEGHIHFSDDIIKISADNGYGKMVTRRRDNHTVRISSLPKKRAAHGGIYYHVSFYDLQAANHITMLPNSVDFVNKELDEVMDKNVSDYWIVKCSNIRPHAYYLDAIRKKWYGEDISDKKHSVEFAEEYYGADSGIANCLKLYPESTIAYGSEEDEHAGEQLYTENTRLLAHQFIVDKSGTMNAMRWLTGDVPLQKQAAVLKEICEKGEDKLTQYYNTCIKTSESLSGSIKQLFDATILLQAKIHYYCMKGVIIFGEAFDKMYSKEYLSAFMDFGKSAEMFDTADSAMRGSEYGVWQGFYFNDCFADVKHTAYMVRKMMSMARELGDNARHDRWYRDAVYSKEDRGVLTLLVDDNHMTDDALYHAFLKKGNL